MTAELAKVYDAVLPGQPGFFARDRRLVGPGAARRVAASGTGSGPLRCLLAEDGSGVRGYALYAAASAGTTRRACPTARWWSGS